MRVQEANLGKFEENTKELSTLEEIKFAITKVGAGFKKIQKAIFALCGACGQKS